MPNGSLTKAVLVEKVAASAGLTNKRAEIVRRHRVGQHRGDAAPGREGRAARLQRFRLRCREPRRGRNPRTGDRVDVPSKRVAYFKPGKELKALLNRNLVQRDSPPSSGPPSSNAAPSESRARLPANARG